MIGVLTRSNSTHGRAKARLLFLSWFSFVLSIFLSTAVYAADGGKVMGTVKDQTGAVVPNAEVDLTSKSTGVAQSTKTDSAGAYTFPLVPVGTYTLAVHAPGFNPVKHEGLVIDIHSVVEQDLVLAVGDQTQTVTVNDSETQVETAETELGETLGSEKITSVPLNGRSYTDLLSVQSGVTPISTSASQSGSSGGSFATATAPSGGLDPGQFSISGQRESANGFVLNGASVVEGIASAAAVIPNLDSIAEFRILTTNSDAEFGNYSGGLVNVVTKTGTNQLHGSLFEFLRNTDLDAKGYFDSQRPAYIQNQFGGTLGGPIRHDKVFFFTDYQGNRNVQGIETAQIPVPSVQDRSGNVSDVPATLNGTVSDAYFASQLSQRLGYPVAVGSPYYTSGCTSTTHCVFPTGVIPQNAWSAPAKYLLQYIPSPTGVNNAGPYFQTAANNERLIDDKGSARVDANTHYGNLSAYYFIDGYNLTNPYGISQGGANLPGFGILSNGLAQLIALSDIKSFGDKMVNEARLSYLRNANNLGQPQGGLGVSPTDQGFASVSQGGFLPQLPAQEGVASVNFNNYTIGASPFTVLQINNTYEASDTFSRVVGNHTIKAGVDAHKDHVKQVVDLQSNGQFNFYGDQTGYDFADFLLGVPSQFVQGYTPPSGMTQVTSDCSRKTVGKPGQMSWLTMGCVGSTCVPGRNSMNKPQH